MKRVFFFFTLHGKNNFAEVSKNPSKSDLKIILLILLDSKLLYKDIVSSNIMSNIVKSFDIFLATGLSVYTTPYTILMI